MKNLILVVLVGLVTITTAHPLEDEELELVELVPVRRFPRGIRPVYNNNIRPNSRPGYYRGPPSGPPQQPNYNMPPQQPQQYRPEQFTLEPLQTAGSRKEPLIMAETGHGGGHGHAHDYVDYGAYTGGYGAFGWYSDHPVRTYGH